MDTNILDLLKNTVSPQLLDEAASSLGESSGGISRALEGIFPMILSGLLQKSSAPNALGGLLDMFKTAPDPATMSASPQGSGLGDLFGMLSGASAGKDFLSSILGDKQQQTVDLISKFSGIKTSSVMPLISMAAPLVMNFFGKKMRDEKMTKESFGTFLASQTKNIASAAPEGLNKILGISSLDSLGAGLLGSVGKAAENIAVKATAPIPQEKKSSFGTIAVIAIALLAIFFLWRSCNKPVETVAKTAEKAVETTSAAATAVGDAAKNVATGAVNATGQAVTAAADSAKGLWASLGEFFSKKLPDGVELKIPQLGIENKLLQFIDDTSKPADETTWFSFDRLIFETGSSTLKPESIEQLKNIVAILKAYPKVELKLGGYTDNTGPADVNLKLSQERANSVRSELIKLGVAENRLTAEGYGDAHPIAPNDTEENRAKNRRIDLRVTKK